MTWLPNYVWNWGTARVGGGVEAYEAEREAFVIYENIVCRKGGHCDVFELKKDPDSSKVVIGTMEQDWSQFDAPQPIAARSVMGNAFNRCDIHGMERFVVRGAEWYSRVLESEVFAECPARSIPPLHGLRLRKRFAADRV